MGIIVSIPQIEGLGTVIPLSPTDCSTSCASDPAKTSAFGVSTTVFSQPNTESTPEVTIPGAQTEGPWPADASVVLLVQGPTSPVLTDTTTRYLSTVTVTHEISSTHLVYTTATTVASNCPSTPTTASATVQSAVSARVSTSSTGRTSTHSSSPAVLYDYGISSSSRLSEHGADTARSSSSVSNTAVSTFSSLIVGVSHKKPSGVFPTSTKTRVPTVRTTNHTRARSRSHLDRASLDVRGSGTAYDEPDYAHSFNGPSVEIAYIATAIDKSNLKSSAILGSVGSDSTVTLTKTDEITTTTVHTTAITKHTSTTTVTTLPNSCLTSKISSSSPASLKSCTSATPNPNPPANNTCAEDGLLEYSNNLQSPDTLEDCAMACLADTSCLSFTFIPSQSTCYTSLYPLADSAFAGTQQEHIYNYDKDCYSCSS